VGDFLGHNLVRLPWHPWDVPIYQHELVDYLAHVGEAFSTGTHPSTDSDHVKPHRVLCIPFEKFTPPRINDSGLLGKLLPGVHIEFCQVVTEQTQRYPIAHYGAIHTPYSGLVLVEVPRCKCVDALRVGLFIGSLYGPGGVGWCGVLDCGPCLG